MMIVSSVLSPSCLCVCVRQFIEKRREMKQEGRTEQELAESYCFLYPDKSKVSLPASLSPHKEKRPWRSHSLQQASCGILSFSCVCFQLQWICEKGLSVGHSRITTLGNPALGESLCSHMLHFFILFIFTSKLVWEKYRTRWKCRRKQVELH